MTPIAGAWFVAMLLFLWLEASTVGIVSIWFAVGALCAMITGICGGELWLQVVVFMVVSIVLLASLRPLTRKYFKPKLVKTNVDAVLGTVGVVTEEIDNIRACGQVKLGAMTWTARSTAGETIPQGTQVAVDRVEGVKLYVTPVCVTANK